MQLASTIRPDNKLYVESKATYQLKKILHGHIAAD